MSSHELSRSPHHTGREPSGTVLGLHFFPLAPLLENRLLYPVAALVTVVDLVAIPAASTFFLAPSALTGAAVGAILLGAALLSLMRSIL